MAASFSATARDFLDVETVNARIQSQLERKNGPATIQYLLMEIRSALEVIGKQQSELEALRKTPSMLAEVPDDLKKAALTARANWDISLGEFGRAYELIRTRSGALQDVMPGLDKKELDAAIAEVEDVITNIGFKNVAIVVTQKHIQERLLVDCKLFKDRALLAEAQLEDLEQKYNDQLLQNQVASEVANEMAVGLANERAVLQTKVADLQSRITAIPESTIGVAPSDKIKKLAELASKQQSGKESMFGSAETIINLSQSFARALLNLRETSPECGADAKTEIFNESLTHFNKSRVGEIVSEVEKEFQSTTNLLTEGEDAKDSIDKLVRVVEELSEEANHTQRLAVELRNALDFFKTSYPECADKTKNLESIWQEIERTASNLVSLAQIWTADALDILDIHRGMKPFLAAADDATSKKQVDFAEYESQQWSARSRADRDNTLILDEDCEREKSDLQTKIKRLKNGLRMSAQEENARIQATLAQANADCDAKNQALRDQIDRLTKDLTTARDRTAIDAKIKDLERESQENVTAMVRMGQALSDAKKEYTNDKDALQKIIRNLRAQMAPTKVGFSDAGKITKLAHLEEILKNLEKVLPAFSEAGKICDLITALENCLEARGSAGVGGGVGLSGTGSSNCTECGKALTEIMKLYAANMANVNILQDRILQLECGLAPALPANQVEIDALKAQPTEYEEARDDPMRSIAQLAAITAQSLDFERQLAAAQQKTTRLQGVEATNAALQQLEDCNSRPLSDGRSQEDSIGPVSSDKEKKLLESVAAIQKRLDRALARIERMKNADKKRQGKKEPKVLEKTNNEEKARIAAAVTAKNEAEASLARARASISKLTKQLKDCQDGKPTLHNAEVSRLKKKLQDCRDAAPGLSSSTGVERLKQAITDHEAEIASLTAQLATTTSDRDSARVILATANASIAQLQAELAQATEDLDVDIPSPGANPDLVKQLAEARNALRTVQLQVVLITTDQATYKQERNLARHERDETTRALSVGARPNVQALNTRITELEGLLANSDEALQAANSEREVIETNRADEAAQAILLRQQAVAVVQARLDNIQGLLDAARRASTEAQNVTTTEIANLRTTLRAYTLRITELQNELGIAQLAGVSESDRNASLQTQLREEQHLRMGLELRIEELEAGADSRPRDAEAEELRGQLAALQLEAERLRQNLNPDQAEFAHLRAAIDELRRRLQDCDEAKKRLALTQAELDRLNVLIDALCAGRVRSDQADIRTDSAGGDGCGNGPEGPCVNCGSLSNDIVETYLRNEARRQRQIIDNLIDQNFQFRRIAEENRVQVEDLTRELAAIGKIHLRKVEALNSRIGDLTAQVGMLTAQLGEAVPDSDRSEYIKMIHHQNRILAQNDDELRQFDTAKAELRNAHRKIHHLTASLHEAKASDDSHKLARGLNSDKNADLQASIVDYQKEILKLKSKIARLQRNKECFKPGNSAADEEDTQGVVNLVREVERLKETREKEKATHVKKLKALKDQVRDLEHKTAAEKKMTVQLFDEKMIAILRHGHRNKANNEILNGLADAAEELLTWLSDNPDAVPAAGNDGALERMRSQLEAQKADMKALVKENKNLSGRLAAARDRLKKANAKKDEDGDRDKYEAMVETLLDQNNTMQEKLTATMAGNNSQTLEHEIVRVTRENEYLKGQVEILKGNVNAKSTCVDESHARLKHQIESLTAAKDALQESLKIANKDIENVMSVNVEDLKRQLEQLTAQNQLRKKKWAHEEMRFKSEIKNYQDLQADLAEENQSQENRITGLESDIERLEEELALVQNDASEDLIHDWDYQGDENDDAEQADLKHRLAVLRASNEGLRKEIAATKKELAHVSENRDSDIADLNAKLSSLKDEIFNNLVAYAREEKKKPVAPLPQTPDEAPVAPIDEVIQNSRPSSDAASALGSEEEVFAASSSSARRSSKSPALRQDTPSHPKRASPLKAAPVQTPHGVSKRKQPAKLSSTNTSPKLSSRPWGDLDETVATPVPEPRKTRHNATTGISPQVVIYGTAADAVVPGLPTSASKRKAVSWEKTVEVTAKKRKVAKY